MFWSESLKNRFHATLFCESLITKWFYCTLILNFDTVYSFYPCFLTNQLLNDPLKLLNYSLASTFSFSFIFMLPMLLCVHTQLFGRQRIRKSDELVKMFGLIPEKFENNWILIKIFIDENLCFLVQCWQITYTGWQTKPHAS